MWTVSMQREGGGQREQGDRHLLIREQHRMLWENRGINTHPRAWAPQLIAV